MSRSFLPLSAIVLAIGLTGSPLSWAHSSTDTVFVSSKLGQPLKATVLLPQDASGLKLAPAESYQAKGLPLPRLDGLTFDFAKTDSGRPFLRVSSTSGYESPAQTLLIEQYVNGQPAVLEYAIFVDPADAHASLPMLPASSPTASLAKPPTQAVAKRKPLSKQAFNAAASSVNQRLSALEKGQRELFRKFEDTDQKLNAVLDKLQIQADKAAPTKIQTEVVAPKPNVTAPAKPIIAEQAAPSKKPEVKNIPETISEKANKKENEGGVSVTVSSPTPSPAPVVEVTPSVSVSASPEKPQTALPAPTADNKPKKPVIKINEPPPAEPTLFETIANEPLYLGGVVAALLALILAPFGIRRLRRKNNASMTGYTVQS